MKTGFTPLIFPRTGNKQERMKIPFSTPRQTALSALWLVSARVMGLTRH
jgi:hypothetical protein